MKKIMFCFIVMTLIITSFSYDTYGNESQNEQFFDEQKNLNTEDMDDLISIGEFYESYLIKNKFGELNINYDKVNQDKLSNDQTNEIEDYMIAKKEMSVDGEVSMYRARLPMYHGNYCGKGNRGGKPKDRLDAACKRHDECYAKYGWGKCKCDKPFILETQKIYRNKKYSLGYRKKAWRAAVLFAVAYNRCR